jgi:hypothetical protein
MGAIGDPLPDLGSGVEHQVLHVDLVDLVAGEGGVDAGEQPVFAEGAQLLAIEVVTGRAAVAEEEPVPTFGTGLAALLEEGTERCNAGARAS